MEYPGDNITFKGYQDFFFNLITSLVLFSSRLLFFLSISCLPVQYTVKSLNSGLILLMVSYNIHNVLNFPFTHVHARMHTHTYTYTHWLLQSGMLTRCYQGVYISPWCYLLIKIIVTSCIFIYHSACQYTLEPII